VRLWDFLARDVPKSNPFDRSITVPHAMVLLSDSSTRQHDTHIELTCRAPGRKSIGSLQWYGRAHLTAKWGPPVHHFRALCSQTHLYIRRLCDPLMQDGGVVRKPFLKKNKHSSKGEQVLVLFSNRKGFI
jgi:hypothetical protein